MFCRGGDSRASYNITPYENYRAVFGWGLWAFPIPTFVTDGCHFGVRYSDLYSGDRFEVVPQQSTSSKSQVVDLNNNPNNAPNDGGAGAGGDQQ